MKVKVFFICFLMLLVGSGAAEERKSDQESTGNDAFIQAMGCYAKVPAEGHTQAAVQFQASYILDDTPGSIASIDAIVGNMRFVPPSTPLAFIQGSPAYEAARNYDEGQFSHILTRKLAVMETDVTWEMWADLKAVQPSLPDNPSGYDYGWGDTNPVHKVFWKECILFANLLSVHNGLTRCYYTDETKTTPITSTNFDCIYCDFSAPGYRLPTEGEWEYFCRAGTTTPFYILVPDYGTSTKESCYANDLPELAGIARYCANTGNPRITQPSCTRQKNAWNLCDTHGNVLEWCWDGYFSYPTGIVTDHAWDDDTDGRVLRGGWWDGKPKDCRSACRLSHCDDPNDPYSRKNEAGFRLVRTLPL